MLGPSVPLTVYITSSAGYHGTHLHHDTSLGSVALPGESAQLEAGFLRSFLHWGHYGRKVNGSQIDSEPPKYIPLNPN